MIKMCRPADQPKVDLFSVIKLQLLFPFKVRRGINELVHGCFSSRRLALRFEREFAVPCFQGLTQTTKIKREGRGGGTSVHYYAKCYRQLLFIITLNPSLELNKHSEGAGFSLYGIRHQTPPTLPKANFQETRNANEN